MSTALKTRKQFLLEQDKIRKVRKIFKAKTDTEAITRALDIIIENAKLAMTLRSVKGKGTIRDIYGRTAG